MASVPSIITTPVSGITCLTAVSGGNVSDGGAPLTARGVCWSLSANPTIADNKTVDGNGPGAFTSTLSGLVLATMYHVRAYATNSIGTAYGNDITFTTPTFYCGQSSFTINHIVGTVAPVSKTVTYGTVTNIPGATTKCWITQNLGSDHQATSVSDATDASAGWYWQFNRKQGFKIENYLTYPNWPITSINETSDWLAVNDPCTSELGSGWRLPTNTEWTNVDASNWNDWSGPWSSGLKLHAAGYLYNGSGTINSRGSYGYYWSSSRVDVSYGWDLYFFSGYSGIDYKDKTYGLSVRCLRDY